MILAFNKPYGVLSQFTREAPHHRTLAEFGFPPGVYPVGRLDSDSEGLLLLSDEKKLVDRLLNPRNRHPRTYWSQVEGRPSPRDLLPLERGGILIRDYRTLPCRARIIPGEPDVPPPGTARPLPGQYSDCMAGAHAGGGQKPPGAAHDRRHGFSYAQTPACQDREFAAGRPGAGHMEGAVAE